jgi:hypothetical protein
MKYGNILRETGNFPITYLKSGQQGLVKPMSPLMSCKLLLYILGLFNKFFTKLDNLTITH